jgi:mono/diheme cytochrome c family protein
MMKAMRHVVLLAALAAAVTAAVACGAGKLEQLTDVGTVGGDGGAGAVLPNAGPAGSGLATGLPCDVQALLENRCIACHSGTIPDSPRLLDYNDLLAPSRSDPSKTMAQASLARMKNLQAPMPPLPALGPEPDEIATFETWVNGGTPSAPACTEVPPDGGADVGPLPEAGPDATVGCASGTKWTQGDTGSSSMHPGRACSACHSTNNGPNLRFAGTVYRGGLHDVDDCNGAAPPPALTVVITDKNGRVLNLPVNAVGNFEIENKQGGLGGIGGIGIGGNDGDGDGDGNGNGNGGNGGPTNQFLAPYRVKVTDGTNTRVMAGNFTAGDCNSCHTKDGANNAPGRILAPEP